MLPNLFDSEKFQNSLAKYYKEINKIKNEETQKKAASLILKLKEEVKNLDQAHRIKTVGELRPNLFGPLRDKIHEIRKKLNLIIKQSKFNK